MPSRRLPAAFLFAAALCAPSLWAGTEYGFQAGFGLPQWPSGERISSKPGFALGYHQLQELCDGTTFRPRVDFYGFQSVQAAGGPGSDHGQLHNRFTTLSVGLESVYWIAQTTHSGAYLFGGGGLACTRLASHVQAGTAQPGSIWPLAGDFQETSNKPYYSMGFGYQFDPMYGVELRYHSSRWSGGGMNLRVSQITAELTWRLPY